MVKLGWKLAELSGKIRNNHTIDRVTQAEISPIR